MKPIARPLPPPNLHKDAGRELFPFCFSLSSLSSSFLALHSTHPRPAHAYPTRARHTYSSTSASPFRQFCLTLASDIGKVRRGMFRLLDAFSQSIEAWIYFPIERRAFPFSVPALDGSQCTLNMATTPSNASTCVSTISAIPNVDDEQSLQSSIDG